MVAPIMRRLSIPSTPTLNVEQLMSDDITGLTFVQLTRGNTILDIFCDPPPVSTNSYRYQLYKNSISTGRLFFSRSLDITTAGRAAIGPIDVTAGQVQLGATQTLSGTLEKQSIVVKFANGL